MRDRHIMALDVPGYALAWFIMYILCGFRDPEKVLAEERSRILFSGMFIEFRREDDGSITVTTRECFAGWMYKFKPEIAYPQLHLYGNMQRNLRGIETERLALRTLHIIGTFFSLGGEYQRITRVVIEQPLAKTVGIKTVTRREFEQEIKRSGGYYRGLASYAILAKRRPITVIPPLATESIPLEAQPGAKVLTSSTETPQRSAKDCPRCGREMRVDETSTYYSCLNCGKAIDTTSNI